MMQRNILGVGIVTASAFCATAIADPTTWITMTDALAISQQAVPNSTPIKVELEGVNTLPHYEIKTFKNNLLYRVRVNAQTGAAFDISSSGGGGAQSKIAEAQEIFDQSIFTLAEAVDFVGAQFPEWFFTEAEVRYRNNIPVFDMDLILGMFERDIHMRVSDGQFIKNRVRLLHDGSDYYDLNLPEFDPGWDTSGLLSAFDVLAIVKQEIGGKPFKIELKQNANGKFRYEVRVLQGNQVVRAKVNATNGTIGSTRILNDVDYVNKVKTAVQNASISLPQAMRNARNGLGSGFVVEAQLHLSSGGARYHVKIPTDVGLVQVKVNAATGAIMSYSI